MRRSAASASAAAGLAFAVRGNPTPCAVRHSGFDSEKPGLPAIMRAMRKLMIIVPGWTAAVLASYAVAADLTADQVRAILAETAPGRSADFSGRSLDNLDLSGLDLRGANLAGANLFGAKLDGADLTGADLSHANLNLAWIMRANFSRADLAGASLQGPVVSAGLEINPDEVPTFAGANFSGARIVARLSRMDLRGANFTGARMGADMKNQSMGLMRTDLSGANLAGANFAGADLSRALLRFADLTGASLIDANLYRADLSGANLSGADVTGADFTEADVGGAKLQGAVGLDAAKGLR